VCATPAGQTPDRGWDCGGHPVSLTPEPVLSTLTAGIGGIRRNGRFRENQGHP